MDFTERMEEMVPETIIHNLSFDYQDQVLEIAYADLRDQAEGVGMVKTIALERELFLDEVLELERDLKNLIDEVQIAIRNKDARQARIDKAMLRINPPRDEDDDD